MLVLQWMAGTGGGSSLPFALTFALLRGRGSHHAPRLGIVTSEDAAIPAREIRWPQVRED